MIVLVGFMGAGKSTIGRLIAGKLDVPFLDSDLVIEQTAGRPVPQIFAEDGEQGFRDLEHRVIADLLAGPEAVLALGGGAPEHPGTRARLGAGGVTVVYLRVSYDQAMGRVGGDEHRPLLARPGLDELYQRRLGVYDSVASLTVVTDGRPPEEISGAVIEKLALT
jgi:shikimate kinase